MTIETKTCITLSESERHAAKAVGMLFDKIAEVLTCGDIISEQTGECIGSHEISRIRGVLSGLVETETWDVQPDEPINWD